MLAGELQIPLAAMAAPSHAMHSTASAHHILGAVSGADVSRRAAAAVLGALVGDAAALGYHWQHDQGKLAAAVAGSGGVVEFAAPGPPYHALRKSGDVSFYGETTLATLRSLRDAGHWSAAAFADAYFACAWAPLCGRVRPRSHASLPLGCSVVLQRSAPAARTSATQTTR